MDVSKIIRLVAVLVAIVVALVPDFTGAAILIAVLGVVAGYFIEEEHATAFLVMALALAMVHGALDSIPYVGEYLTAILGSLSSLVNAAACTVIGVGIYNRLKP